MNALGKSALLAAGVALAVLAAYLWIEPPDQPVVVNETSVPPLPTLDAQTVAEGQAIYAQYCAACHGANLEGAPNWRVPLEDGTLPPPPHNSDGHTWHHTDALLHQIVSQGSGPSYNGTMPAFGETLTEAQIWAALNFIKSKWGKDEREFQWWMTVTRSTP